MPWFVGGGAQHSPDVARLVAYNANGGREGVLGAGDLQVKELEVPGDSVRVMPGACTILNRTPGYSYQAYAGRMPSQDVVEIASTGSNETRSDLIVARVEDPTLSGSPWDTPVDVTAGPYIFTRVISDVPSSTTTVTELGLGYSAIPLARIDLEPNTGTITQDMITDLRGLAKVERSRGLIAVNWDATSELTSTSYVTWPTGGTWSIYVPTWATKLILRVQWEGVRHNGNGSALGDLRWTFGTLNSRTSRYDTNITSLVYRQMYAVSDTISIPSAMRGTTQTLTLQARRATPTGTYPGTVQIDNLSGISIDYEFVEQIS